MGYGLLFFAAFLALMAFAARKPLLALRERHALRMQHPGEPWMWRRDWADRTVHDESAIKSGFLWVFGIVWILMSLPALFVLRGRYEFDRIVYYFILLFPIVGICVLIVAAYHTLRRRKYGVSLCRFERLPIPIGSAFRGEVQARVRDVPEGGFQVRLACIRREVRSSGKSRSVRETTLWEDAKTVGSGAAMPNPDGVRIPIHFAIPADADPTDDSNSRDSVLWRLEVRADVPGIDYATRFQLPVFRTADSPQGDVWPAEAMPAWTTPPSITFGLSRTGGEEVVIRPSVHFIDWFGYLVFIAFWFGALAFIYHLGAPLWAVSFFAVFGTIVLLAALDILAGRSRISADRQTLASRRSWLGLGRTRKFDANEVEDVVARIGQSSGSSARYNIEARFRDGRRVLIAKHLANKRDADGVAARLRRAIGR